MRRALLSQMTHEWKNNIWLVIELGVVALSLWAILTLLWVQCKGVLQPLGFNPQDVYTLDVKNVPSTSPYYIKGNDDKYFADRNELIRRLRKNPNVVAVSLHNNFAPFEYNYVGNDFAVEGFWPDSVNYWGNMRKAEPDIIKVMDIKSTTGKTQEQLISILQKGDILISKHEVLENQIGSMNQLIGKKINFDEDESSERRIGDVVDRVRRSKYEADPRGVFIMPINPEKDWGDVILRIKPNKISAFINDFNSDPSLSHHRNVYLSNLKSLVRKGEALDKETDINIRLMVSIAFFLLITIFLGLLGSFWFRVQQRVSEIAIRKTFGATDKTLFQRIIGEGLILLVISIIIISVCVWPFLNKLSDFTGEDWWIFLVFEVISAGVMALGIIFSLWYPAWRAMKIEPAIAVKTD